MQYHYLYHISHFYNNQYERYENKTVHVIVDMSVKPTKHPTQMTFILYTQVRSILGMITTYRQAGFLKIGLQMRES